MRVRTVSINAYENTKWQCVIGIEEYWNMFRLRNRAKTLLSSLRRLYHTQGTLLIPEEAWILC